MVCVEAKVGLAICIPLNVSMARMQATGRELVVVRAMVVSLNYFQFSPTIFFLIVIIE